MIATIFDAIVRSDRHGRGAAGETFASDMFKDAGYKVKRHKHMSRLGDLRVIHPDTGEFWDVEVKTARRREDGRWCFQLITDTQDYRHANYVLLLAVSSNGIVSPFLIPTDYLKRRGAKTITLPKNPNASVWSHFRVKWTVRL